MCVDLLSAVRTAVIALHSPTMFVDLQRGADMLCTVQWVLLALVRVDASRLMGFVVRLVVSGGRLCVVLCLHDGVREIAVFFFLNHTAPPGFSPLPPPAPLPI